jgi:hypothetical protein
MADGTQIRITAVDATSAAFRSVQNNINGLQGALRGIAAPLAAAFSVAGIVSFMKSTIDLADRLNDVAMQTGFTVEQLSALGNAAKLNGSNTETLTTGLIKLNRAISEAGSGSQEQLKAFQALGITQEELRNKAPIDIFYQVADAFSSANDGAVKTDISMKLLGRSGAELIPVLNQGSTELKKFGASFTAEDAQKASEFNDNIDKIVINLQKMAATIFGPILKGLNSFFASLEKGKQVVADTENAIGTFDMFMPDFDGQAQQATNSYNKFLSSVQEGTKKASEAVKKNLSMNDDEEKRITERLTARNEELIAVFKMARQPINDYQDAIQQLNSLKAENLITLEQYYNALEKIEDAYSSTLPKIELNDTSLKKYISTISSVADALDNMAVRSLVNLEDALVGVMMGTMSVKDAFKSMAASIVQDLIRIQIQQSITKPLGEAISGAGGFSAIFSSIFGGGKALGGTVNAGEAYMVGEKGAEMFVPGKTGTIVPNNQLGGSGAVVNQTINISTGVSQTVRAEVMGMLPRIVESTKAAVADANRRGGSFAKMMA